MPDMSKWRYAEVRAFCRQHPEKRAKAAALLRAGSPSGGGARPTAPGDPTARAAMRREALLRDVALVEEAAAAMGRWQWALLRNACYGQTYDAIAPEQMPTSNRNAFFKARRMFFSEVRRRLDERNERP